MTEVHDGLHGIVHSRVVEWEVSIVNAIIAAASWRVRGA